MKIIAFFLFAGLLTAQSSLPLRIPAPSAPQVSVSSVGAQGFTTYYYVVVVNYPSGAATSQVAVLQQASATLSSPNHNQVGWNALQGALTYDVLRLPTPTFSGTCTCSVATGLTVTTFSDTGGSLSSYTAGSPALAANATVYLDNTDYAFPKMRVSIGTTPGGANADHLAEVPGGATLPTYCTLNDLFIKSGSSPGPYYCSAPNTWTASGGGGGGTITNVTATAPFTSSGGSTPNISGATEGNGSKLMRFAGSDPSTDDCAKFDAGHNVVGAGAPCGSGSGTAASWSVIRTSATVLTTTLTNTLGFNMGTTNVRLPVTPATYTLTSGTGTVVWYLSGGNGGTGAGVITVASNVSGTCSADCTVTTIGSPLIPNDAHPIAVWAVTSGNYAGTATTLYPDATFQPLEQGTNMNINCVAGPCTLSPIITHGIGYSFDGGGSALTSGLKKYVTVPFGCTVTGWNIAVDAGTATVDVWKIASGTAIPTIANTITGSAVPAISTGTAIHSATLTGWTLVVAANDIFGFNLSAVSTATYVNIMLGCQ